MTPQDLDEWRRYAEKQDRAGYPREKRNYDSYMKMKAERDQLASFICTMTPNTDPEHSPDFVPDQQFVDGMLALARVFMAEHDMALLERAAVAIDQQGEMPGWCWAKRIRELKDDI